MTILNVNFARSALKKCLVEGSKIIITYKGTTAHDLSSITNITSRRDQIKRLLSTLLVFLTILFTACAPLQTSQPDAMTAVVVTAQGGGGAVGLPLTSNDSGAGPSATSTLPANGVTLSENGGVFVMHVGESFLLNLGMDVYDWTVEVDSQNVIQRKLNLAVIRGAQGIYIAQNTGTATLTASGNPLCQQSNPPCMMPSILFSITVIVQ